jgi:hypothetical protein
MGSSADLGEMADDFVGEYRHAGARPTRGAAPVWLELQTAIPHESKVTRGSELGN